MTHFMLKDTLYIFLGGYECKCRLGYELHSDDRRCENACGGLIDASNGTITSPSFPDIYPSNKEYTYMNIKTRKIVIQKIGLI